jgi:hypothetical protein
MPVICPPLLSHAVATQEWPSAPHHLVLPLALVTSAAAASQPVCAHSNLGGVVQQCALSLLLTATLAKPAGSCARAVAVQRP